MLTLTNNSGVRGSLMSLMTSVAGTSSYQFDHSLAGRVHGTAARSFSIFKRNDRINIFTLTRSFIHRVANQKLSFVTARAKFLFRHFSNRNAFSLGDEVAKRYAIELLIQELYRTVTHDCVSAADMERVRFVVKTAIVN